MCPQNKITIKLAAQIVCNKSIFLIENRYRSKLFEIPVCVNNYLHISLIRM